MTKRYMEQPLLVLAVYKAKPGCGEKLTDLVSRKRKYLLENKFVTSRPNILVNSFKDPNLFIEIFEWVSQKRIDDAHKDEGVWSYWKEFEVLCDEVGTPLSKLPEGNDNFPNFKAIN
jgi:hypothetical protein